MSKSESAEVSAVTCSVVFVEYWTFLRTLGLAVWQVAGANLQVLQGGQFRQRRCQGSGLQVCGTAQRQPAQRRQAGETLPRQPAAEAQVEFAERPAGAPDDAQICASACAWGVN